MRTDERDGYFMGKALVEAKKAASMGEIPVGAVVVAHDRILSRGHNLSIKKSDATAHAEILAVRRACVKRKNYRLPDCELFVTLEPCAMCLGAVAQARIRRLVFGALDPKAGAVRSIMRFPWGKMNHRPKIRGGPLADECALALKDFFSGLRKKKGGRLRKPLIGRHPRTFHRGCLFEQK